MTPLTLQILCALADRDMTSAELLNAVKQDSQMALAIKDRSFYAALHRLTNEGQLAREFNQLNTVTYRLSPFWAAPAPV